jgi:hypothetical protein
MTIKQITKKIAKFRIAKDAIDNIFAGISDEELVEFAIQHGYCYCEEKLDPLLQWEIASTVDYELVLDNGESPIIPVMCFEIKNMYKQRRAIELKITKELLKKAKKSNTIHNIQI